MKLSLIAAVAAVSSVSAPARGQAFGPDSFGYSGVRITGATHAAIKGNGGVLLTPADPPAATLDDRFYSRTIGFTFPFYGTGNTTAFVSTNGFLSLGGTTNTTQALDTQQAFSYTNATFASAAVPLGGGALGSPQVDRAMISPWWDDMQFTSGQAGGIYTLNRTVLGIDEFVVEYNNVAFFNATTNGVTFQTILRSDGSITFNYLDVVNGAAGTGGASATIGIRDLGGTTGNNRFLQWRFNTASAVGNGDQINIVPGPSSAVLIAAAGCLIVTGRRRRK